MKKAYFLIIMLIFFVTYGLVGSMDRKLQEQELAWYESVQALQMEQEKAQADIIRLQEQCAELEDMTLHQGIRLYEFYQRMNFEFIDSLESEE